jgi:predicted Zn-dependent peptidase
VIAETPVEIIRDFHAARYVPSRIVIAAAGSVDHDELVALAEAAGFAAPPTVADEPEAAPAGPVPEVRFQRKDTEQVHVCLGAVGLARDDERRFAARVLDAIFGGLSSSRLFQAVREERGLAYSVFSFSGQFADTGQVGLYLGTRPENLGEAMTVVAAELERLRAEPGSAEELERARENVKARIVLGLESSAARMNRIGSSILFGQPVLEPEELMQRIDAVTLDDLAELAAELWAPERLSAAGIGPDEDAFRSALEVLR